MWRAARIGGNGCARYDHRRGRAALAGREAPGRTMAKDMDKGDCRRAIVDADLLGALGELVVYPYLGPTLQAPPVDLTDGPKRSSSSTPSRLWQSEMSDFAFHDMLPAVEDTTPERVTGVP